jgi:hypothetical protein
MAAGLPVLRKASFSKRRRLPTPARRSPISPSAGSRRVATTSAARAAWFRPSSPTPATTAMPARASSTSSASRARTDQEFNMPMNDPKNEEMTPRSLCVSWHWPYIGGAAIRLNAGRGGQASINGATPPRGPITVRT